MRSTVGILAVHGAEDVNHLSRFQPPFFTKTSPFRYSPSGNVTVIG